MRRAPLALAVALLAVGLLSVGALAGCRATEEAPPPLPPRAGSPDLPATSDPAVPEPCKHRWESDARDTHSFTTYEGGIPNVQLCTPIHCSKCGAVRHECAKWLRRKR